MHTDRIAALLARARALTHSGASKPVPRAPAALRHCSFRLLTAVGAAKEDAAVGLVVVVNHVAISSGPLLVGALSSLFGLTAALPAMMLACCLAVVLLARRALTVPRTDG